MPKPGSQASKAAPAFVRVLGSGQAGFHRHDQHVFISPGALSPFHEEMFDISASTLDINFESKIINIESKK